MEGVGIELGIAEVRARPCQPMHHRASGPIGSQACLRKRQGPCVSRMGEGWPHEEAGDQVIKGLDTMRGNAFEWHEAGCVVTGEMILVGTEAVSESREGAEAEWQKAQVLVVVMVGCSGEVGLGWLSAFGTPAQRGVHERSGGRRNVASTRSPGL